MSLYDHLRELRYRFVVSAVAVLITALLSAIFYGQLFDIVMWPWNQAYADLKASNPDVAAAVVNQGVGAPFMLALRITLMAGVLAACPIWLWQLWAFIVPALHDHERKYAVRFMVAAIPLFLSGAAVGYIVMPKGISVMLQFTPDDKGITNLLEIGQFLTLELTLVLLFGLSFLLPVILVMLNIAGVVTGAQLGKARAPAIFGTFVFAALATPSTDPFSMLALAMPMGLMYLISEIIAKRHDRRKAKKQAAAGGVMVSLDA